MVEREHLLQAARRAAAEGRRAEALQAYTVMLVRDRRDPDAALGLRRLGVELPREDEIEAAPALPAVVPAAAPRVAPAVKARPPLRPEQRRSGGGLWYAAVLLAVMAILTALLVPSCSALPGRLAEASVVPPKPVAPTAPADSANSTVGPPGTYCETTEAAKGTPPPDTAVRERWLTVTSALWRYAQLYGRYPARLDQLVPGVLHTIPAPSPGQAWVYTPPAGGADLWSSVAGSLRPQAGAFSAPTFQPITIRVKADERKLQILSGEQPLREFVVGVGGGQTTPKGTFTVTQRDMLAERTANGKPNPYGTRWLKLSVSAEKGDYGIHGTDDPTQVGGQASNGCLVLGRRDLEELFDMIPLGTPVTIE